MIVLDVIYHLSYHNSSCGTHECLCDFVQIYMKEFEIFYLISETVDLQLETKGNFRIWIQDSFSVDHDQNKLTVIHLFILINVVDQLTTLTQIRC